MHKILSLVVLFFYFFCLFFPVTANAYPDSDGFPLYTYYFYERFYYDTSPGEYLDAGKSLAITHNFNISDIIREVLEATQHGSQFSSSRPALTISYAEYSIISIQYYQGDFIPSPASYFSALGGEFNLINSGVGGSYPFRGNAVFYPMTQYTIDGYFYSTLRPTLAKSLPHNSTYTIGINNYFTLSSYVPLNLSGLKNTISAGLLSVSSKLDETNRLIGIFQSAMQSDMQNIDARLLQLIQAVNNSSNSGGGTSAIVNALKDLQNDIVDFRTDNVEGLGNLNTTLSDGVKNLQDKLDLVNESTKDIVAELKRIQQEANERAESGSGQIQGMVQSLEQGTRERWEVIFFPVDFTRQIFSIFSQGTASEYFRTNYKNIVGYKYNDETYCLDPVYDYSKTDFPTTNGTKITFPEFVLDIPHYGRYIIWESFTYDLRELVADFDIMFEAMHLFSGILLIYWTVDYILDFFQEVIED